MAKKRRSAYRSTPAAKRTVPGTFVLLGGLALAITVLIGIVLVLQSGGSAAGAKAWVTLGTRDVHSLAFEPGDSAHLFFGHHGGLLETVDGGHTWRPTTLRGVDAMSIAAAGDGLVQIAGHDLYQESTDGGRTWQHVPNNLPSLDIHSFAASPLDQSRAWAFAVGYGLFETADRGRTWELRQSGAWGALTVFGEGATTVLLAAGPAGLARSEDGGRTWAAVAQPAGQVLSLAAGRDGGAIYAGTSQGLSRSTDGGRTWFSTNFNGTAVAVAVYPGDASVVAVVDDGTRFFRSADGGDSWPGPS